MRWIEQLGALAALGACGCQPQGFESSECVPDGRRAETFDAPPPDGSRCWKTEQANEPAYIRTDDGDLVVHPQGDVGASWVGVDRAPFLFQTLRGDFLAVARAEMISGVPKGDHCLSSREGAGLAVRRREPMAWSTLLVSPDLNDTQLADRALCGDDPERPPAAKITAASSGFGKDTNANEHAVGSDAEAEIAVCRKDALLYYYYQEVADRTQDATPPNLKDGFMAIEVGYGPLDVGVTATATAGAQTLPEGHFNWLVVQDYAGAPISDGCPGALEDFVYPEAE